MFNKKMYYNLVKFMEETSASNNGRAYSCNNDYYLGISYFHLNLPFEAVRPLKRYVNSFLKSSSDIQRGYIVNFLNTLNMLFKIMMKNKNYAKCQYYLLTAKKYIYKYSIDDSPISFIIHNNLALLYLMQCRYMDIIDLLNFFIYTHKDVQSVYVMASMYLSLNIAYYNLDEYKRSIECLKKAIYLYLYFDKHYDAGESYFNYINALRYSLNFKDAFIILDQCLQDYKEYENLYDRFLIQKMILKFNTGCYDDVLSIAEDVNVIKLPKANKCNYCFMIGNMEYMNHNYKKASQHLLKCEKYFKQQGYIDDLCVLYSDLFDITNNKLFRDKAQKCKHSVNNRKNIIIRT